MMQTRRDGTHSRSLARQIGFSPMHSTVFRNEDAFLGGRIDRRLTFAEAKRDFGCGNRNGKSLYAIGCGHEDRLLARNEYCARGCRGTRIDPDMVCWSGKISLLLPRLAIIARNEE